MTDVSPVCRSVMMTWLRYHDPLSYFPWLSCQMSKWVRDCSGTDSVNRKYLCVLLASNPCDCVIHIRATFPVVIELQYIKHNNNFIRVYVPSQSHH